MGRHNQGGFLFIYVALEVPPPTVAIALRPPTARTVGRHHTRLSVSLPPSSQTMDVSPHTPPPFCPIVCGESSVIIFSSTNARLWLFFGPLDRERITSRRPAGRLLSPVS